MRFTRVDEGRARALTARGTGPINETWTLSVVPYARPQLLTFTVKNGLIPWQDRHICVRVMRPKHTARLRQFGFFTFT